MLKLCKGTLQLTILEQSHIFLTIMENAPTHALAYVWSDWPQDFLYHHCNWHPNGLIMLFRKTKKHRLKKHRLWEDRELRSDLIMSTIWVISPFQKTIRTLKEMPTMRKEIFPRGIHSNPSESGVDHTIKSPIHAKIRGFRKQQHPNRQSSAHDKGDTIILPTFRSPSSCLVTNNKSGTSSANHVGTSYYQPMVTTEAMASGIAPYRSALL